MIGSLPTSRQFSRKGTKVQCIPANHRPVSLTSVTCKLFEHILFCHIISHLEQFNVLSTFQHGFRSQHSCESQLIITIEDLARNIDNKIQTDVIILDFQKAFDTVPHQRLLQKLDFYGIHGPILCWIQTWLTSRMQKVVVDGECSCPAPVRSGVPQGTVLGNNNIPHFIAPFCKDSKRCCLHVYYYPIRKSSQSFRFT